MESFFLTLYTNYIFLQRLGEKNPKLGLMDDMMMNNFHPGLMTPNQNACVCVLFNHWDSLFFDARSRWQPCIIFPEFFITDW